MKRFMRWLFRAELERACISAFMRGSVFTEERERQARAEGDFKAQLEYLRGLHEGAQSAFEGIDRAMRERRGSEWTEDDVTLAKRRWQH